MSEGICTVHQKLSGATPVANGSEIRLPSGEAIPRVTSVTITALPGGLWETTLTLITQFGEAIQPLEETGGGYANAEDDHPN